LGILSPMICPALRKLSSTWEFEANVTVATSDGVADVNTASLSDMRRIFFLNRRVRRVLLYHILFCVWARSTVERWYGVEVAKPSKPIGSQRRTKLFCNVDLRQVMVEIGSQH
jgi:hypothetical protein